MSASIGCLLAATAPSTGLAEPVSAASLCETALRNFRAGPVKFEESGTSIRPSGEPVLDRVVELASTCRQSVIEITGHTDSSGDETWNQILSLERAKAVADYLAARGIARERLVVKGAGSSEPVADNARRYGRSLNRRIEIVMRPRPADDMSQQASLSGSSA
ncbi:MAG: OmpA family protein [Gammaproteobacteria bacterium]|nr:OmpA family protein [Gammaproteobacteria bacterium]